MAPQLSADLEIIYFNRDFFLIYFFFDKMFVFLVYYEEIKLKEN